MSSFSSEPHPEELSRRISQIDLTRQRSYTLTSERATPVADITTLENAAPAPTNLRYSLQELLQLSPAEGVISPARPNPPPSTPIELPLTPPDETQLAGQNQNVQAPAQPATKKKKKSGSGKNKKSVPTGFEEFYADPPVTPDEYEEERDLYVTALPLSTRIETCLQRYRKRRNLDSFRSNILTKYLMLGGIEASTTKSFTGGLDKETLQNATADEIAAIQATDHIRSGSKNVKYYDPSKPEGWVVDFEGIVKGFLSWHAPNRLGMDNEKIIQQTCGIIENFLNYLLLHAVCPEHTEDILAARRVCGVAQTELWSIANLRANLPGDFNIAASTVHKLGAVAIPVERANFKLQGGRYHGNYIGYQAWAKEDPYFADNIAVDPAMDDEHAEKVFKAGVAHLGGEKLFEDSQKPGAKIIKTETKAYEVVSITRATHDTVEEYLRIKPTGLRQVKALGVVRFIDWEGPGIDNLDMTDDESAALRVDSSEVQEFWIEDDILKHFFVGLKCELLVRELNYGLKFFDTVVGFYCSFHTILPNEKVIENWKEPVLNTRPPPTEENPEEEESAEVERDAKELESEDKTFGDKKTYNKAEVKNDENVKEVDKTGDETGAAAGTKKIDVGVGVKVKAPKANEAPKEESESKGAVFHLGEMEEGEDGGLYPVGKED